MDSGQFHTLNSIAKVVAFLGWVIMLLSASVFVWEFGGVVLGEADSMLPLVVVSGAIAGAALGLIMVAMGQFFACIVQMSRDLLDIADLNTEMLSAQKKIHKKISRGLQMVANLNSETLSVHEGSIGESPDGAVSSPYVPEADPL